VLKVSLPIGNADKVGLLGQVYATAAEVDALFVAERFEKRGQKNGAGSFKNKQYCCAIAIHAQSTTNRKCINARPDPVRMTPFAQYPP